MTGEYSDSFQFHDLGEPDESGWRSQVHPRPGSASVLLVLVLARLGLFALRRNRTGLGIDVEHDLFAVLHRLGIEVIPLFMNPGHICVAGGFELRLHLILGQVIGRESARREKPAENKSRSNDSDRSFRDSFLG